VEAALDPERSPDSRHPASAASSEKRPADATGALAAVDDVSFEIPDGQPVAVLGPNGAGKPVTGM
jgi:ABC-type uncharacterized transport system ATPase subunit